MVSGIFYDKVRISGYSYFDNQLKVIIKSDTFFLLQVHINELVLRNNLSTYDSKKLILFIYAENRFEKKNKISLI